MTTFRREKNCTFCSRNYADVDTMFWSREADICICDACVTSLYNKCPRIQLGRVGLTAQDIYRAMKGRVVGQDDCLRELSVVLLRYIVASNSKGCYSDLKVNCLLVGPTGCGKTMTVELAAKILGYPFLVADCSRLTPAGYVGDDVEGVFSRALKRLGNNVSRFEHSWLFLDEFDKIVVSSAGIRGEIGKGDVQQELLKPIEGCKIDVPLDNKKSYFSKTVTVNTRNMLFLAAGCFYEVFDKLDKAKKYGPSPVFDFRTKPIDENDALMLRHNIVASGIIPELAARFPAIIRLRPLNKSNMLQLLSYKYGRLNLYIDFVMSLGVSVAFTDDALSVMADHALKLEIGCRGLNYILDRVFQHIIYSIGSCGMSNYLEKVFSADEVDRMVRQNIPNDDCEPGLLTMSSSNAL